MDTRQLIPVWNGDAAQDILDGYDDEAPVHREALVVAWLPRAQAMHRACGRLAMHALFLTSQAAKPAHSNCLFSRDCAACVRKLQWISRLVCAPDVYVREGTPILVGYGFPSAISGDWRREFEEFSVRQRIQAARARPCGLGYSMADLRSTVVPGC